MKPGDLPGPGPGSDPVPSLTGGAQIQAISGVRNLTPEIAWFHLKPGDLAPYKHIQAISGVRILDPEIAWMCL